MSQTPAVARMIDEGLAAEQVGDLAMARHHFEAALAAAPADPEALHLIGLICEQENKRSDAINFIKRAIEIDPDEPLFRLNLAAILEKNNELDEAARHIEATVQARPQSSELVIRLGDIEFKRNKLDAAIAAYRRGLELAPQNPAAFAGYGKATLLSGNSFEARRICDAALQAFPADTDVLELALRLAASDRNGQAIAQVSAHWQSVHSSNVENLNKLTQVLNHLGYNNEASKAFDAVLKLDPDSPTTLLAHSRYCLAAQRFDQAREALDKLLTIEPDSVNALFAMSRLEYFVGDLEAAEALCVRVLDRDPHFPAALTHLCSLRRGDMTDEQMKAMAVVADDPMLEQERAYEMLLALSKAFDRKGHTEKAFQNLQRGNEIGEKYTASLGGGYDAASNRRLTNRLIYFYRERPEENRIKPGPYTPIFIVGAPRSGTTLTESIIAAHPDTFSIGEMSSLPHVNSRVMRWAEKTAAKSINEATNEQLEQWRDLYFSYFDQNAKAKFLIDKQPHNIRYAGLIRTLFPGAKIVYVRRNAIETGFSIYRHPFDRQWPFSYQQAHIASFLGDNARIADHWEKLLGNDFPLFQYETLIADFEGEVRRMLAHCGLSWDDRCLEFHNNSRTIATFSSVQARQPVRKEPERAASRYQEYLDQLRDGLAAANVDIETGALLKA